MEPQATASDTSADPAVQRYHDALRLAAELEGPYSGGLFAVLTTLLRGHELASPIVSVDDGMLHVERGPDTVARTVSLATAASAVLGSGPRSVSEALGLGPGRGYEFLRGLQQAIDALCPGTCIEQLWMVALEALVVSAPSGPERLAVFTYAGVGAEQPGIELQPAVAALIDHHVDEAGFLLVEGQPEMSVGVF